MEKHRQPCLSKAAPALTIIILTMRILPAASAPCFGNVGNYIVWRLCTAQETPRTPAMRPIHGQEEKIVEPKNEVLTDAEKERLRRADNLSAQMAVFINVAAQYINLIREATSAEQITRLNEAAESLSAVYRQASAHMQQSTQKKKHRQLKKFEIALREQLLLLKNLQSLSSAALRESFKAPIAAGERTRKEALSIIFEGGTKKK
ncbi:MAG: hypothetical protein HYR55_20000 [Acidobacteria bacterium]|nr:hypothetical protein [Acidobacteriota bacterium]MBI3655195.1 hypothetical protein [Acidobacteriota bacterium]